MSTRKPREGDLKVYWIPQVPMEAFEWPVRSVKEAIVLCDVLAEYDRFQFKHNVKPDYSNAGGLLVFEDGEWLDWISSDDVSFDEYYEAEKKSAKGARR